MEKIFTKDHIGMPVTCLAKGKGLIVSFMQQTGYPVYVKFNKLDDEVTYTESGLHSIYDEERSLYHGHNVTVKVEGEEIPEPKLICPVCGVEHEFEHIETLEGDYWQINNDTDNCPFQSAKFDYMESANTCMENLIKAMENK